MRVISFPVLILDKVNSSGYLVCTTPPTAKGQGEVKRRYAVLRMTLLCDASGTRINALMSRLFEPKKAVAFTSFSTNFTFFFP